MERPNTQSVSTHMSSRCKQTRAMGQQSHVSDDRTVT